MCCCGVRWRRQRGGAAPTFRLEDLHLPGLKADFALIVAEGDQGWGKDSSLEDGGQGGVLLFAVPRCRRCHLRPGAAARNPSDLTHWVIRLGANKPRPASLRRRPLACLRFLLLYPDKQGRLSVRRLPWVITACPGHHRQQPAWISVSLERNRRVKVKKLVD